MARAAAMIALAACAVAAAGCGAGSSADGPPTTLVVTEDFGAGVLAQPADVPATAGLTVLRQLETGNKVTTSYGGRYVESIAGVREDADSSWLFYVDGIESKSGAASARLKPGQAVQWDFHPWQSVRTGGAIVGAYPRPLRARGVRVICAPRRSKACAAARRGLRSSGVAIGPRAPLRMIVGAWSDIEGFDGVPDLTEPGDSNGAFAQFSKDGRKLTPFAADGSAGRPLGAGAGLVAAFANGPQPAWVVTGTDAAGAAGAAALLAGGGPKLRFRFAAMTSPDGMRALPEDAG